jgi:hypothetical protein
MSGGLIKKVPKPKQSSMDYPYLSPLSQSLSSLNDVNVNNRSGSFELRTSRVVGKQGEGERGEAKS